MQYMEAKPLTHRKEIRSDGSILEKMKAIIEVKARNGIFDAVQTDIAAGGDGNFHLSFDSAHLLHTEVSPARLALLETLRQSGPCSVYALAKHAGRNYSNVHSDVGRLIELGLIERTEADTVSTPFDEIEVHYRLAEAA